MLKKKIIFFKLCNQSRKEVWSRGDVPCTEYWRDDPFSRKVTSASCSSCQVRRYRSWWLLRPYATRSRASPRISRHRSIWTANFNNNVSRDNISKAQERQASSFHAVLPSRKYISLSAAFIEEIFNCFAKKEKKGSIVKNFVTLN